MISVDVSAVIAIIERRRAKFQGQRRAGPQEHMDEAARLIAEEYETLLAEIEVALASRPEMDRTSAESEATLFRDREWSRG